MKNNNYRTNMGKRIMGLMAVMALLRLPQLLRGM